MKTVSIKKTFALRRGYSQSDVDGNMDFNIRFGLPRLIEKLHEEGHLQIEHLVYSDRGAERVETTISINVAD